MSKSNWDHPEITPELIEQSIRKAHIERSRVVWGILQSLFSRPESRDNDNADFNFKQSKLRLG